MVKIIFLKKDEDDKLAELAAKYRDRAAERRDGSEAGGAPVPGTEDSTTTAYRWVGLRCYLSYLSKCCH